MKSERSACGCSQWGARTAHESWQARVHGLASDSSPAVLRHVPPGSLPSRLCLPYWARDIQPHTLPDGRSASTSIRPCSPPSSPTPPAQTITAASCSHVWQWGMCSSHPDSMQCYQHQQLRLTPHSGERGCLRDTPVAGHDEKQAQGGPDGSRLAEAQE